MPKVMGCRLVSSLRDPTVYSHGWVTLRLTQSTQIKFDRGLALESAYSLTLAIRICRCYASNTLDARKGDRYDRLEVLTFRKVTVPLVGMFCGYWYGSTL